jgi:hypothetical protein
MNPNLAAIIIIGIAAIIGGGCWYWDSQDKRYFDAKYRSRKSKTSTKTKPNRM